LTRAAFYAALVTGEGGRAAFFTHTQRRHMDWYKEIFGDEPPLTEEELVDMFADYEEGDDE